MFRNNDSSNIATILGASPIENVTIDIFENSYDIENQNIVLLEENERLKKNLIKLIKSYPKEYIFKKVIDNKCSICLENYKYDEKLVLTNCLHIFHKECLDKSIEQDCLSCPNCRFELVNSVFLYINFKLEYVETEFL